MRDTEFVVSGDASPTWQPAEPEHPDAAPFAQCSLLSGEEQPGQGCSCPHLGLWGMHVLQPQPCQHHTETLALLTSLLPEQVHFINEGILKGLILPLALFKTSLHREVPHSWPRMLSLTLAAFVNVVQYINPRSREIKDLMGLLP